MGWVYQRVWWVDGFFILVSLLSGNDVILIHSFMCILDGGTLMECYIHPAVNYPSISQVYSFGGSNSSVFLICPTLCCATDGIISKAILARESQGKVSAAYILRGNNHTRIGTEESAASD